MAASVDGASVVRGAAQPVACPAVCGIVGLFTKSPAVSERLGAHTADMLAQLADRGPDSAGVAVYRDPVGPGQAKLVVRGGEPEAVVADLAARFGAASLLDV